MRAVTIIMMMNFFLCFSADSTFECIGLGEVCTVAAALQVFELRNAAYPFDWIISQYKPLCSVLQEDFDDFLNPYYFSVRADNHGVINKYGLVFVHDFPTIDYSGDLENNDLINENKLHPQWIESLPIIQDKYNRRIQRLRDICMSDKKVYFIRHGGISRDGAYILREIIKNSYPNLDFTLVIVGNDPTFTEPWNEENISNYYLGNQAVWNDVGEWYKIFTDLNIISTPNKKFIDMDALQNKFLSLLEQYQRQGL